MAEYFHVEQPFLDQLSAPRWHITDQGQGIIPANPAKNLRGNFREWLLPKVFRDAVRAMKLTPPHQALADRSPARRPSRSIPTAAQPHVTRTYETNQGLFLKAQVDHNE
ncbi:MAG: hypothetical protein WD425_14145 [Nitrospirales bacterium]